MRLSRLFIVASTLCVWALPATPDMSTGAMLKRQAPALPFPSGQSSDTCPASGGNTYDSLEPSRRRSLGQFRRASTGSLQSRALCSELAHGNLNHFPNQVGNTAERLLTVGATYVFSWAFNEIVAAINVWRHNADGTFTQIQSTGHNQGSGTMTVQINGGDNVNVHFEVVFDDYNPYGVYDVSGEFALFQTANGDQNPDK
ncbi:hypothetical protein ACLMJK_008724 [Lecanora helva]